MACHVDHTNLYQAVARAPTAPVITSGGISTIEDLIILAEVAKAGANLEGSIVGRAVYTNRFSLRAALAATGKVG
jgi:phosphoribosyl isomerase A